jgi:hypothetical protein
MVEYVATLFSSYVEIHAAQLGALLGLFVGLIYRERPTLAYALLTVGVLSAFGYVSGFGFVLYGDVARIIQLKPWYFLSALYGTTVANFLVFAYGPALWSRLLRSPGPPTNDVVEADDG